MNVNRHHLIIFYDALSSPRSSFDIRSLESFPFLLHVPTSRALTHIFVFIYIVYDFLKQDPLDVALTPSSKTFIIDSFLLIFLSLSTSTFFWFLIGYKIFIHLFLFFNNKKMTINIFFLKIIINLIIPLALKVFS